MRRRSGNPPSNLDAAEKAQPRVWLTVAMLVMLVAVLFAAFRVLPVGSHQPLSNRRASRLLADARRWEEESLFRTAAEIYERVSSDGRLKAGLREDAARRLVTIYREHLDDPRAAESALEKAYILAGDGAERELLGRELASIRAASPSADDATRSTTDTKTRPIAGSDPEGDPVARIGEQIVTLEEILYAWGETNGMRPPEGSEFESFVEGYLNLVLLADEAERRGLERSRRLRNGLRFKRVTGLSQALQKQMIEQLDDPTSEALEAFYSERIAAFSAGGQAKPLDEVRDEVMLQFQQRELAEGLRELLADLRRRRPIEIFDTGVQPPESPAHDPTARETDQ